MIIILKTVVHFHLKFKQANSSECLAISKQTKSLLARLNLW